MVEFNVFFFYISSQIYYSLTYKKLDLLYFMMFEDGWSMCITCKYSLNSNCLEGEKSGGRLPKLSPVPVPVPHKKFQALENLGCR